MRETIRRIRGWGTMALAGMAALSLSLPGYGMLSAEDEKCNQMLPSETRIHVEERFDPPDTPVPGTSFTKEPVICNDGPLPCYVRMKLDYSLAEAEAVCEPIQTSSSWSKGADGYYYYPTALGDGGKTEALFSSVSFRQDVSQEELDACLPFEILVYAEAVLANGKSMQEAWDEVRGGTSA